MTNTEAWERIAARRGTPGLISTIQFGQDLPTEADLRLDEGPISEADAYARLAAWARERGITPPAPPTPR